MPDYLIFAAIVVVLWTAATILGAVVKRLGDKAKPDELTALADAVRERCGAVLKSYDPDHVWHDCDHAAGHWSDAKPLHHCRCGTHWANPLRSDNEIRRLNAMLAAPDYQEDQS